MSIEKSEREAFEEWANKRGLYLSERPTYWIGWQARANINADKLDAERKDMKIGGYEMTFKNIVDGSYKKLANQLGSDELSIIKSTAFGITERIGSAIDQAMKGKP